MKVIYSFVFFLMATPCYADYVSGKVYDFKLGEDAEISMHRLATSCKSFEKISGNIYGSNCELNQDLPFWYKSVDITITIRKRWFGNSELTGIFYQFSPVSNDIGNIGLAAGPISDVVGLGDSEDIYCSKDDWQVRECSTSGLYSRDKSFWAIISLKTITEDFPSSTLSVIASTER